MECSVCECSASSPAFGRSQSAWQIAYGRSLIDPVQGHDVIATDEMNARAELKGDRDAVTELDRAKLAAAAAQLENPGLAGKLADAIGTPVERLLDRLPDAIQTRIDDATKAALEGALSVALKTMGDGGSEGSGPWNLSHKIAATMSGVAGGFFGAPALLAELPVTTGIMLRSIADIARSHGEDLSDPEAQLACLEVFALGSGGPEDETEKALEVVEGEGAGDEEYASASYYIARAALAQQVKATVAALAKGSVPGIPAAASSLVSKVTARYGLAVSEKAAAQAVPILGAVGGGLVNALFMDHFQDTAEAHFTVRQMERKYGIEPVEEVFEAAAKAQNS